jgi:hypothetical protein
MRRLALLAAVPAGMVALLLVGPVVRAVEAWCRRRSLPAGFHGPSAAAAVALALEVT